MYTFTDTVFTDNTVIQLSNVYWQIMASLLKDTKPREKVTTTKITMSKTKKNIEKFANHHNVKNGFWVDHNYDITTSKMAF